MTDDLVERVAKAIYECDPWTFRRRWVPTDGTAPRIRHVACPWKKLDEEFGDGSQEMLRIKARAAIAAMENEK